jgi:hypothetical protein
MTPGFPSRRRVHGFAIQRSLAHSSFHNDGLESTRAGAGGTRSNIHKPTTSHNLMPTALPKSILSPSHPNLHSLILSPVHPSAFTLLRRSLLPSRSCVSLVPACLSVALVLAHLPCSCLCVAASALARYPRHAGLPSLRSAAWVFVPLAYASAVGASSPWDTVPRPEAWHGIASSIRVEKVGSFRGCLPGTRGIT